MPLSGGTPTQVHAQIAIEDITVISGKVYTLTWRTGRPSEIWEYDPLTNMTRTLGTAYPEGQALGVFNNNLLLGTQAGDLYTVDVNTGLHVFLVSTGQGPILAIGSRQGSPLFSFATGKSLFRFPNVAVPIYTSATGTIEDITVGIHDQASFLAFGRGCPDGARPAVSASGLPSIGNSSFTLFVGSAPPSSPGAMLIGASRQVWLGTPLPMSLGSIGMTGCTLYTDVFATAGFVSDGAGLGSVRLPIPAFQWKGGHFTGEFVVLSPGANPLGVAASDGFEGIVR